MNTTKAIIKISTLALALTLTACAGGFRTPAFDETGDESATEIDRGTQRPTSGDSVRTLSLNQAVNIRRLVGGVLELAAEVPEQSVIQIPTAYEISYQDYRTPSGSTERSSTGFVGQIKVVSVPGGTLSKAEIAKLNATASGLFVSASVATAIEGITGNFKSIPGVAGGAEYLNLFDISGKPKFSFTAGVTKRFGTRLNKAVNPTASEAAKYRKIFDELQRVAARKVETPKSILLVDKALGAKLAKEFEATGAVPFNGAWTIAVTSTAVRHGFENVPCAEFMSEILREAYQRAGVPVSTDFNDAKGNRLLWSKTASVTGISNALYAAGWVPWEPSRYRVPVGAFMMHASGLSPGHTFIAGGDDGRIVVDNGSPQGRDLRATTTRILKLMYETGVFFLPPGITPTAW